MELRSLKSLKTENPKSDLGGLLPLLNPSTDMFSTVKPPAKYLPPGEGLFNDAQMASYMKPLQRWWAIRVEGHDTGLPADDIKKALKDHFGSCGAIAAVEVHDSYAIVSIFGDDADDKALKLNGSELGGRKLVVDPKSYPRIEIPTTGIWFGSNPACTT